MILAAVACLVSVLAFQETRRTELEQAQRSVDLRRLALEKIERAQRKLVFTFWYIAHSLPTVPDDQDPDLRSDDVVRGLAAFDLSKTMKMERITDHTDQGYQTTWAQWMRSNVLEANDRLVRVVQIFGQYLDVEVTSAVLAVVEAEFITGNDELFGDSCLFAGLGQKPDRHKRPDARPESDVAAEGRLGAVGVTRLAGLETNMFGSGLKYRQYIDALVAVAGKVAPSRAQDGSGAAE